LDCFLSASLNDEIWSFNKLINNFGPSLKKSLNFDFNLLSNSIYTIGQSFTVNEGYEILLNNLLLDVGTYYFSYYGTHNFRIKTLFNFDLTIDIIVLDSNINISNNGSYISGFIPILNGFISLLLNAEEYIIDTPITTPGLHTLVIYGENGYEQEIMFTIALETGGVTDESTYTNSVTPIFSGGTSTLNGVAFESGTEITYVG
jgi:hypothetical protein